jgi:DNA gyrase/topoisomerase IV subunit A
MDNILIFTKMGRCIRFNVNDCPIQNRGGCGIRAMQLEQNDEVVMVVQNYEIELLEVAKKKAENTK